MNYKEQIHQNNMKTLYDEGGKVMDKICDLGQDKQSITPIKFDSIESIEFKRILIAKLDFALNLNIKIIKLINAQGLLLDPDFIEFL